METLDRAEDYVKGAPDEILGLLATDGAGLPVEVNHSNQKDVLLRRATSEPEGMPSLPDQLSPWKISED